MKSDITGSVTVNRNIITGTQKSFYPASSDAGVANLTAGRYTIDCSENCLYDNIRDLYGVTQIDGIYQTLISCLIIGCIQKVPAGKPAIALDVIRILWTRK